MELEANDTRQDGTLSRQHPAPTPSKRLSPHHRRMLPMERTTSSKPIQDPQPQRGPRDRDRQRALDTRLNLRRHREDPSLQQGPSPCPIQPGHWTQQTRVPRAPSRKHASPFQRFSTQHRPTRGPERPKTIQGNDPTGSKSTMKRPPRRA